MIEITHYVRDSHRFVGWYIPDTGVYHVLIETDNSSTHDEYPAYSFVEEAFSDWARQFPDIHRDQAKLVMREQWKHHHNTF